jgi:hypothetical protein
MAGHRRVSGQPKKAASRAANWRARIAAAATSEEYFDTASDWLRAAASHMDPAERTTVLNEAGQWLAQRADVLARAAIGGSR